MTGNTKENRKITRMKIIPLFIVGLLFLSSCVRGTYFQDHRNQVGAYSKYLPIGLTIPALELEQLPEKINLFGTIYTFQGYQP